MEPFQLFFCVSDLNAILTQGAGQLRQQRFYKTQRLPSTTVADPASPAGRIRWALSANTSC